MKCIEKENPLSEAGHIKKNIKFFVEGKTEGASTFWGKGIWNILREEKEWMSQQKILHDIKVFDGKFEMVKNLGFYIEQHFTPPKKTSGIPGDYAIIIRDLDCENKTSIENKFNKILYKYKGMYAIHFAIQEIEAWIVADMDCFRSVYKYNKHKCFTDSISKIPYISEPEKIDCNPKISEYLENIAKGCTLRYRKTIEGIQLLREVNPDTVCTKCPAFKYLRNDLWELIDYPEDKRVRCLK
ncbi:DUF4276 family protein [Candidatus Magnetominusculus xianensis]|uniref:DUF4276 family protein n=1 Tax=Candidatus Magnetominusculus xianensis TaxID=1748249 RepID=A0ABR5SIL8_9BACT|nr:DUF4276 family protein [Candidatus Magnetominusculus xianensis]KWT92773.1 hypothetical protein ASN18_0478 [Candidatus Magnetominusculus xianensis]MBF0405227.1 DUF4276 family protein [Nitrospirota bacterium]